MNKIKALNYLTRAPKFLIKGSTVLPNIPIVKAQPAFMLEDVLASNSVSRKKIDINWSDPMNIVKNEVKYRIYIEEILAGVKSNIELRDAESDFSYLDASIEDYHYLIQNEDPERKSINLLPKGKVPNRIYVSTSSSHGDFDIIADENIAVYYIKYFYAVNVLEIIFHTRYGEQHFYSTKINTESWEVLGTKVIDTGIAYAKVEEESVFSIHTTFDSFLNKPVTVLPVIIPAARTKYTGFMHIKLKDGEDEVIIENIIIDKNISNILIRDGLSICVLDGETVLDVQGYRMVVSDGNDVAIISTQLFYEIPYPDPLEQMVYKKYEHEETLASDSLVIFRRV